MLNNRGQSLVLFIFIIPIIVLVILAVIDIGKISLLKEELDDINYMVIDYGLDNIENIDVDTLKDIIIKNKDDIENIDIKINNQEIKISLESKINLLLIKNSNILTIKSKYIGYVLNGKKVVERDKW